MEKERESQRPGTLAASVGGRGEKGYNRNWGLRRDAIARGKRSTKD